MNVYTVFAESGESDAASKKKTKRMRTTFTEEQIQILQANFQIDSNPDGQDLERIAQITGLSKRVTQVWFQNCRARQKKYINNGKSRSQSELEKRFLLTGSSARFLFVFERCVQRSYYLIWNSWVSKVQN